MSPKSIVLLFLCCTFVTPVRFFFAPEIFGVLLLAAFCFFRGLCACPTCRSIYTSNRNILPWIWTPPQISANLCFLFHARILHSKFSCYAGQFFPNVGPWIFMSWHESSPRIFPRSQSAGFMAYIVGFLYLATLCAAFSAISWDCLSLCSPRSTSAVANFIPLICGYLRCLTIFAPLPKGIAGKIKYIAVFVFVFLTKHQVWTANIVQKITSARKKLRLRVLPANKFSFSLYFTNCQSMRKLVWDIFIFHAHFHVSIK